MSTKDILSNIYDTSKQKYYEKQKNIQSIHALTSTKAALFQCLYQGLLVIKHGYLHRSCLFLFLSMLSKKSY